MKNSNRSQNSINADWQIMGDLELLAGVESCSMICSWLVEILTPLGLHGNFLDKVSKSVWEAATRTIQADQGIKSDQFHLIIVAPKHLGSKGQTWGFFRIEKVETSPENENTRRHSLEYYLYPEEE